MSQALAEMLLDGNGAQAWISWARRKAELAAGITPPEPPAPEPPAEPVPVTPADHAAARREARNAAYRAQRANW